MKYPALQPALLLRRYKRFLADVRLPDGSEITVHCPNTGAMTGCAEPGSKLWLQDVADPRRKYPYRWELVATEYGLACIHSAKANELVAEALQQDVLPALQGFTQLRREVSVGEHGSRLDFVLDYPSGSCAVEVKSVTLCRQDGLGCFPDAVSSRGQKHLRELIALRQQGQRAVLLFAVLHNGINRVSPADDIDPVYARLLRQAAAAGVEVYALGASISAEDIALLKVLPVFASMQTESERLS